MIAKNQEIQITSKMRLNVQVSRNFELIVDQFLTLFAKISGHGTYMCGICQCAPDYFGRRCECDAESLSFHGDLEAGCRPDNTTTTLCNNRGDCMCGKCECYPRENPNEVRLLFRVN